MINNKCLPQIFHVTFEKDGKEVTVPIVAGGVVECYSLFEKLTGSPVPQIKIIESKSTPSGTASNTAAEIFDNHANKYIDRDYGISSEGLLFKEVIKPAMEEYRLLGQGSDQSEVDFGGERQESNSSSLCHSLHRSPMVEQLQVKKALDMAQAELRSCYKRLGFSWSNTLQFIDETLLDLEPTPASPVVSPIENEDDVEQLFDKAFPNVKRLQNTPHADPAMLEGFKSLKDGFEECYRMLHPKKSTSPIREQEGEDGGAEAKPLLTETYHGNGLYSYEVNKDAEASNSEPTKLCHSLVLSEPMQQSERKELMDKIMEKHSIGLDDYTWSDQLFRAVEEYREKVLIIEQKGVTAITVVLSPKAKQYFAEVMYGLEGSNEGTCTESEAINHILESNADFEAKMDIDVLGFITDKTTKES